MKRLIALITTGLLITSSFAFAAPNNTAKIDTSIGTLKKDQPLAEFVVDMDKLKATLIAEKQAEVKATPQKKGVATMTVPKVEEPKIIIANDLPENNISQSRPQKLGVMMPNGKIEDVPTEQVYGKSVTITKKQLMEADLVVMEGALLKDFRIIGKAKDGGDIMAIDIMQLYVKNSSSEGKEKALAHRYNAMVNAKNEPDGIKRINGTNVVPPHGEYPLSYYTQGQKSEDINVGQWYTIVWGNSLTKWTNGIAPNSIKDFNYLALKTEPQEQVNQFNGRYYIPATNATQLIITELDK